MRRLRSGALLVECGKRQQATNLMATESFVNIPVTVSAHRTLNTSKGIVRDRDHLFAVMTEFDIVSEMKDQGVTYVKRFTTRRNNEILQTHTYLFSFSCPTAPKSIKAGYCNIKVDTYIPNPLRCFKCQRFGHGVNTCKLSVTHTTHDCDSNFKKCTNWQGIHSSFSKDCPIWKQQMEINKITFTRDISCAEAEKLVQTSDLSETFASVSRSHSDSHCK